MRCRDAEMGAENCCQWHQAGHGSVSRAAHTGDHCVPRENLFLTDLQSVSGLPGGAGVGEK